MNADKPAKATGGGEMRPRYRVSRFKNPPLLDTGWDGQTWHRVDALAVARHMGEKPLHFPGVLAKVGYDTETINVIFRVDDQYVRAVARGYQDNVYEDSCVEFFFTPGSDISIGYFNLEMNCGGTALFDFHPGGGDTKVHVAEADFREIKIAHTMPSRIEPEILTPVTWLVEYGIPFAILRKYCDVAEPRRGEVWRANFYKCGDNTSHPHWLTWSHVEFPSPQFHLPAFFGVLEFA